MNYEKGDRWGQGQERVMEQWCLSEYKTCMHENVITHFLYNQYAPIKTPTSFMLS